MTHTRLVPRVSHPEPSQALLDAIRTLMRAADSLAQPGGGDLRVMAMATQAARQFIGELAVLRAEGADLLITLGAANVPESERPLVTVDMQAPAQAPLTGSAVPFAKPLG